MPTLHKYIFLPTGPVLPDMKLLITQLPPPLPNIPLCACSQNTFQYLCPPVTVEGLSTPPTPLRLDVNGTALTRRDETREYNKTPALEFKMLEFSLR
jgi:hypothetical protein